MVYYLGNEIPQRERREGGMKSKRVLMISAIFVLVVSACGGTEIAQVKEVTRLVEVPVDVEVTRLVGSGTKLEVTRIVEVTSVVEKIVTATPTLPPPATKTPDNPKLGTRENPYPLGAAAKLVHNNSLEFEFSVVEVLRGEEAWGLVNTAGLFNSPPAPGEEYIMAKIVVDYTGPDAGVLELTQTDIAVVSQGRIYDWWDVTTPTGLNPRLDFQLLSGGHGEGWFAWPLPPDPHALLMYGPFFFSLADTPVTANSPAPSTDQETEVLSGTGSSIVEIPKSWVESTSTIVRISGTDVGGVFRVTALDDSENQLHTLITFDRDYEGYHILYVVNILSGQNMSKFEVETEGRWTIEVVPPVELAFEHSIKIPGSFSGVNDAVVVLPPPWEEPTVVTIRSDQEGANILVLQFTRGQTGSPILVNEPTPYEGTFLVPENTIMLSVNAVGPWTVETSIP